MNSINDPLAAIEFSSAVARIPGRRKAAIRRAEQRFRRRKLSGGNGLRWSTFHRIHGVHL
jgi:hypothetical protein